MDETKREKLYSGWKKAVNATRLFKQGYIYPYNIGLSPSGKATGSDPVITGSNPVSPANY